MADALVVTHSDIKEFMLCRRRWYLNYVADYRKPESLVGALALGTRVHSAIEHYYRTFGDAAVKHEELFRRDLATLEDNPDTPSWAIDQLYEDVIIGRHSVNAHQKWLEDTGADEEFEVEAVEETVSAPLLDGMVELRGKVDVLFRRRDNDFLVVNDLKTDGGRPGVQEQLERSWQHHIYLIALTLSKPERIVGEAYYTVVRKLSKPSRATKPQVERHRVPGTTRTAPNKLRQLEVVCAEMLRVRADILEHGLDHAFPEPNHECGYCPYKQPCDLLDESPEAAVEMLEREYIRGGRHGRYA